MTSPRDLDRCVSLFALQWELELWEGGAPKPFAQLSEAAASAHLRALRARHALLSAGAAAKPVEEYMQELAAAIADEKSNAAAHTAAGDVPMALHCLRRAKMMSDELDALD